jgi:hypothetical protein
MAFTVGCFHGVMNMTVGTFAEAAPSGPDNFGRAPITGGWEQSSGNGLAAAAALIATVAFALGALVGLLIA